MCSTRHVLGILHVAWCQDPELTHTPLQALQQLVLLLLLDEVPLCGHEVPLPQQLICERIIALVTLECPVQLMSCREGVWFTSQALEGCVFTDVRGLR